jgi:DNA-binding response OmpR family regulator
MVKKILIIEDEPDIAETMKMLIEKEGYKVDYSLDPKKGIPMIKKYDLLLLDIIMPTMSGREVLAEMLSVLWGCQWKLKEN